MIIIRPIALTDTVLNSSNVAENDDTEWSNAAPYSVGDTCMDSRSGEHRLLECLIAHTNQDPSTNPVDGNGNPYWLETGPTNRWAMLSDSISTQTQNAESIVIELEPGKLANGIGLFNLDAHTVNITGVDPVAGEIYNKTTNLQTAILDSWYSFFFEERTYAQDMVALDLPVYPSAAYTITISKPGGTAKCGFVTLGRQRRIGDANYGTAVGITNYSSKTTDDFGIQSIVKRGHAKRAEFDVSINKPFLAEVMRILTQYKDTPATWIGSEDAEPTILFGFYWDLNFVYSNPALSQGVIRVEGYI